MSCCLLVSLGICSPGPGFIIGVLSSFQNLHIALINFIANVFSRKLNKWVIHFCSSNFFCLLEIPNYSLCFVFKKSTPDLGLSLSHSHLGHVAMDN